MHRPWWKRLLDRGRGRWWPVHYRTDTSTWWSFRGKQYLFRERPMAADVSGSSEHAKANQ